MFVVPSLGYLPSIFAFIPALRQIPCMERVLNEVRDHVPGVKEMPFLRLAIIQDGTLRAEVFS